ncbi:uncharacterized protein LOC144621265 [Crassostrea virginica]
MSLLEKNFIPGTDSGRRLLDVPSVSSVIDTGFHASHENNNCLYDISVTDDKKVWNKQVIFSDEENKAIKTFNNYGKVVTLFRTKDWKPPGITGSASGDILVCLCRKHHSKVVRYSNTGTVLQEIQYDSDLKPLYRDAWHIDENVNGDIIVTDLDMVVAVDRLGIHKYTYWGENYSFDVRSIATDIDGNVFVVDCDGDMIHMLDINGRFLRYIIPREGLQNPRAICMIGVARGEEWHKLIDNHVKKLHRELDDLKKENEAVLEKQMLLEVPTVTTVIHAGNNNNLLDMTVTDDRKVLVAVQTELKLFDLQGYLHRSVMFPSY